MTELFDKDKAIAYMEQGDVVFFAGGIGHPYFSTDMATVLMAIEVQADVILSGKAIDGVYDSDPKTNPNAKKYDSMKMSDIVDNKLGVIDLASAVLAMENKMPMMLFGLNDENSIVKAVTGGFTGTYVKMQKSVENLEAEYATIRAGRANPNILNKIKVEYYGVPTPMQQLANITVPEARTLVIAPWEPSLVKEIEKAIMNSDLGITPNNDGRNIILNFPELTEDRRKELVKDIKKKGEGAKVAIRNIRRDANDAIKKMEKNGDISEDELKDNEDKIQKLTDKYVGQIDKAVESKSKEIMTV